ncbi:thiamine pyrophosphate-dependent dehydrogenase E1 component subunit alpha [Nakamurella sp. YIM 132087]|uniref:Thiamine pyrophosphate-dependent dehydrogenase E1 component subunit alpha n=1 Tax=Nakamurella alba TaxID=2665158 RepID=A0A7K1FM05_9ACTN|nr:thiamine pyrophosphate-dependent dehydrogenase E1 component subunit alpha [Nakamurella alba]MTD15185.1 thiamine pyrophosphate-dependent dehydrogenase E1 component subunit alpha [Nakamurella alba]
MTSLQDAPPDSTTAESVTKEQLSRLFSSMAREEAVDVRIRNGIKRGEFATVIWPSRGQEAISAAIGLALRPDDRLVTTYRGLHDHVAKGVPLPEIIGEVLGTSTGASRGKGGTMHIADPDHGVMMTTGIVGSGVPVAVGLALAAVKDGVDRVAVVTFGDGATNTGSFHEGVNLAAVWKLPVIFVCQNNLYAEMTPVEETMAIEHVAQRALGLGLPGVTVDGNDPVATYQVIRDAVALARAGGGPTLIEAVTFRFEGHYAGDGGKYIPAEQYAEAKLHDPMVTFPRFLLENGFTAAELDEIRQQAADEVEAAVKVVVAAPPADLEEIRTDVYADGLVVTHD